MAQQVKAPAATLTSLSLNIVKKKLFSPLISQTKCKKFNLSMCGGYNSVCFQDRVSLCSSGCPETHYVEQASLKFRYILASTSQALELKA